MCLGYVHLGSEIYGRWASEEVVGVYGGEEEEVGAISVTTLWGGTSPRVQDNRSYICLGMLNC